MAKTIIISEGMQNELNDMLSMTQFKFKSNIKKFLAELLEDPIGAMPGMIFTHNGLDKNKLIKSLVDNKVINKKMTIDDHDSDGTPHKAKMIVRYSVPKERFNDRLDALYDVLFPDVPAKINEDGGGATSCSVVDGNGFGSGEFIQPMGGVQRHPGDPKKKVKKRNTVGGDAYSVEINEAVNEYQDSLINTDDFSSLPSFAQQVAYCKEKLGAPIGNGSSRMVFRVDDNKVLKLAKNRKGRAQNEAECENCNDYYAGDMFAKVFEYDQNNFTYIIAEEARPPKSSHFKTCLGVTYQEFCRICLGSEREYSYGPKKMQLPALTQEDYDMLEENDALREWHDYITNYQPTSVYELIRKCNLGLATNRKECRHGLKIIITDSGFNDNVKQMYYGKVNEAVTGDDADKSAALYVYNEDGDHNWFILCARRANRKGDEEGGKWNPPMGHLHKGESIKDGAIRECLEESGIDFSKYKSEIRVNDHLKWGSNCILNLGGYVSPAVTIDDFEPKKGDEENSKFIWLPLEEIDTKTWAWTCGENAKKFIPGEIDLTESVNHGMLTENKESKMRSLARKYSKSNGYSDEQAKNLEMTILHDIPNARLGDFKFFLGVTRLAVEGQLSDGQSIMKLNQYLKLLANPTHINEYDNNLNGMSLSEIDRRFATIQQQFNQEEMDKSNARQFTENSDYQIVKIPDAETASQYGEYTSWCVTHNANMYESYTGEGLGLFYFCLKNGFENVPAQRGENCPLDEYGLSMIAVSVNMDGSPNTITCRWNHDNGGNDNVMTPEQLEQIIGRGFYKTFLPYTREELHAKGKILFDEVQGMLDSGADPKDVFDRVGDFKEGAAWVRLNGKNNFINKEVQLISDQWYDGASNFREGFALVQLNGKLNYINHEGRLLCPNQWFDLVGNFSEGFAIIELNGKCNFINQEGHILSPDQWFDRADNFQGGFAWVRLNDKYNYINQEGQLLSPNQWFEVIGDFYEGFAIIRLNGKWNYINQEGQILSPDQWFEMVGDFREGFSRVRLNDKYNYINHEGQLLTPDQWYDWADNFKNGFGGVQLNGKPYYIYKNGTLYDYNTRQPIQSLNKGQDVVAECVRRVLKEYIDEATACGTGGLPGEFDVPVGVKKGDPTLTRPSGNTMGMHDRVGNSNLEEGKKKKSKVVKNDKGEVVPETCTCGGHIGLYICGEPVYKCAECGKYYGTMPFPKNLDEKYEHDWKECENEEDDDYPEVEMIGDKYNYRRNDGSIMFPYELFDYCGEYRYGVGVIQKGDRWNFVDVDGNLLSPYEWFDRCYQFHDGVGRVEKNDRDAFMNKYGNYIISRWFDDSRQFKDGYGLVRINNNWKYIDLDGHIYTSKPIKQKQYK